jgi:hypothetical protein
MLGADDLYSLLNCCNVRTEGRVAAWRMVECVDRQVG